MAADQAPTQELESKTIAAVYEQRRAKPTRLREEEAAGEQKLASNPAATLTRYGDTLMKPFSYRTFFVTKGGVPGVCTRDLRCKRWDRFSDLS